MTFVNEGKGDGAVSPGDKVMAPATTTELPAGIETTATILKRAGYATAHFGKWHMGRANPREHGFDENDGPNSNGGRALSLNGAFSEDGVFNRPDVHAAEIPAANGITNAAALARVYAATFAPVDGVQLLEREVLDVARTTVTPENEPDACLIMPTTFGMGFMTHGAFTPYAGPGSYGHPGAGGSVAFAQPERELGFGYVMNKMASNLANDARAQRLTEAAAAAADRA